MADTIDLNSATAQDLAKLPFMNEQRARLVADYVERHGPLNSMDDVDQIPGIGDKLSHLLADYCSIGNSSSSNNRNNSNDSNSNRDDDQDSDNNRNTNNQRNNSASGVSSAHDGDRYEKTNKDGSPDGRSKPGGNNPEGSRASSNHGGGNNRSNNNSNR